MAVFGILTELLLCTHMGVVDTVGAKSGDSVHAGLRRHPDRHLRALRASSKTAPSTPPSPTVALSYNYIHTYATCAIYSGGMEIFPCVLACVRACMMWSGRRAVRRNAITVRLRTYIRVCTLNTYIHR